MSSSSSSSSSSPPPNSVKVRVLQIEGITDPETGKPGKSIKLVQVRQRSQQPFFAGGMGSSDDAGIIRNIMQQFQSMGLVPMGFEIRQPKLNLFLTESEYDLLGVHFEVNEVYDMILKDGTIRFSKSTEGI